MFGFTCLIKADTDLVKRCLQESKNDVELLTALYDEVLDTDTDAEGMWPTEELATPVEEYSLIFGCREASELIYFAEGMRKRALYSASRQSVAKPTVTKTPAAIMQHFAEVMSKAQAKRCLLCCLLQRTPQKHSLFFPIILMRISESLTQLVFMGSILLSIPQKRQPMLC